MRFIVRAGLPELSSKPFLQMGLTPAFSFVKKFVLESVVGRTQKETVPRGREFSFINVLAEYFEAVTAGMTCTPWVDKFRNSRMRELYMEVILPAMKIFRDMADEENARDRYRLIPFGSCKWVADFRGSATAESRGNYSTIHVQLDATLTAAEAESISSGVFVKLCLEDRGAGIQTVYGIVSSVETEDIGGLTWVTGLKTIHTESDNSAYSGKVLTLYTSDSGYVKETRGNPTAE